MAGADMFAANQLPEWRELSAGLDRGRLSPARRAIDLYSRSDTAGLRALHRECGTLAELGMAYVAADEHLRV